MSQWHPNNHKLTWWLTILLCISTVCPPLAGFWVLLSKSAFSVDTITSHSMELQHSIWFTLKQAAISSLIVCLFAPLFSIGSLFLPPWIRKFSYTLRILLFCLPSAVVASGIILAWGNNGLTTRMLDSLGLAGALSALVYSKYGVVIANILMNLPFASIVIQRTLLSIPNEQLFNAKQLGLKHIKCWSSLLFPLIKPVLIYYCGLTALMSMGSFGALAVLGGGPQSETIELSIYRSIYFNAEWDMAAIYSFLHILLAGAMTLLFVIPQYHWMSRFQNVSQSELRCSSLLRQVICSPRAAYFLAILSILLDIIIITPLICIIIDGMSTFHQLIEIDHDFIHILTTSIYYSLIHAVPSATLCVIASFFMSRSFMRYKIRFSAKKAKTLLMLVMSSAAIPTMSTAFGLLVINSILHLKYFQDIGIILLHASLALPFTANLILPSYSKLLINYDSRRTMDGISAFLWWRVIEFPQIISTLIMSWSIAFSLSFNETSIVTMLNDAEKPVLTTTMIRLMEHYQFGLASLISCILILVTFTAILLVSNLSKVQSAYEYS
jgi:thiamine transport system permease protein